MVWQTLIQMYLLFQVSLFTKQILKYVYMKIQFKCCRILIVYLYTSSIKKTNIMYKSTIVVATLDS